MVGEQGELISRSGFSIPSTKALILRSRRAGTAPSATVFGSRLAGARISLLLQASGRARYQRHFLELRSGLSYTSAMIGQTYDERYLKIWTRPDCVLQCGDIVRVTIATHLRRSLI